MPKRDEVAPRATLTVVEAGEVLGVGRGSAYEAARRGDLPTIRVGRRLLVPRAALDALLAASAPPPSVAKFSTVADVLREAGFDAQEPRDRERIERILAALRAARSR